MKTSVRPVVLFSVLLFLLAAGAEAEYSQWSFGGGLNLVYNSDSSTTTTTDGTPGGIQSAPSPITGFLVSEYRVPITGSISFAPSASVMFFQYLWANDRALPAEIENRTAFVPTLFLDLPVVYRLEAGRFDFTFGLGPGILIRYGFLESGVSADETSYSSDMPAGQQVSAINNYFWSSGRWFYPTVQIGARYQLETGWGARLTLRAGIPIYNLWSSPSVTFADSFMFIAAIVITPPAPEKQKPVPVPAALPSLDDPLTPEEKAILPAKK